MIPYKRLTEDIVIPLNKNDKFYWGKFKNKTAIYDHDYVNEKGDLIIVTDTGKEISACKIRMITESISRDIIKDMRYFGLSKNDIDSNGYVTLYHGGVKLPKVLKKNEIFFMTSSKDEAKDYANMRKGKVFTLKVSPEDVNWNQGSGEVEFTKGGKIIGNTIIPNKPKTKPKINKSNKAEYKGIKVGDIMPKSGWIVLDIVIYSENNAQFKFKPGWYDANEVLTYENL